MGENGGGGGVAGCSSIDGASIGAGGITLSAGAAGGAGGDGGNISLTQKANIVTSGAGANAVLIQSIGGGCGFISGIGRSEERRGGTGGVRKGRSRWEQYHYKKKNNIVKQPNIIQV